MPIASENSQLESGARLSAEDVRLLQDWVAGVMERGGVNGENNPLDALDDRACALALYGFRGYLAGAVKHEMEKSPKELLEYLDRLIGEEAAGASVQEGGE